MRYSLYIERDTVTHRLDPRTKIVIALCFFSLAVCFNHPLFLLLVLAALFLTAILAKVTINIWRLKILLGLLFIFSTILWNLFIREGKLLFEFYFVRLYDLGLLYSIGMGLRLNIMTIAGIVFISTTKKEAMTWGLYKLGLPYVLSFTISMAFSLVPMFITTALTVVEAQRSRGLDLESGTISSRIKKHIPLLVPVFLIAIRNSNKLSMALESKGFSPSAKRTFFIQSGIKKQDVFFIVLCILLTTIAIVCRINGWGIILNRL